MGGGGCCGPDVRSPPGGERRGVSSTRHPRRPSSFMSLPSPSQPRPAAAARSPPPASLPAVFRVGPRSWGTAARLGGEGRVPPQRPETGRGPGAGGGGVTVRGGGKARPGVVGSSAPPPAHLAGPAERGRPQIKAPSRLQRAPCGRGGRWGSREHPAGVAAESAPRAPLPRRDPTF